MYHLVKYLWFTKDLVHKNVFDGKLKNVLTEVDAGHSFNLMIERVPLVFVLRYLVFLF
jgi:hypothetical protein